MDVNISSIPCVTCAKSFLPDDDVVFCPVCNQPYHSKCWTKNGGKCQIFECNGKSNVLLTQIEQPLLTLLGAKNVGLVSKCSECSVHVSYLQTYCDHCGKKVNPLRKQKKFFFFTPIKWFRKNYILLSLLIIFGCALISGVAITRKQNSLTRQAPVLTTTPSIIYKTSTQTPKPTRTPKPTSTKNHTPTAKPTQSPANNSNQSASQEIKKYAEISCSKIYYANLRRSPGYSGKDDSVDSLYEIPCGELVEILGPTQKVDGLTWWKVSWNDYSGWIADHTGSGKIILVFQ
jgi:hypothetical protein